MPVRNVYVGGRGNPDAEFMIIGEAPGAQEEKMGQPFVGPSGKMVDKQLQRLGIHRKCWITNVVKQRPENNRTPTDLEIQEARAALLHEIHAIEPKRIMGLGNVPLFALTGLKGITRHRGKPIRLAADGPLMFFTFHPAYILRGGLEEDKWALDWTKLVRYEYPDYSEDDEL
jgi:uracil-DNA glycosylase family 4